MSSIPQKQSKRVKSKPSEPEMYDGCSGGASSEIEPKPKRRIETGTSRIPRTTKQRLRPDLPVDIVATDSEWDESQPDPWLCTTFATPHGVAVCFRNDLPRRVRRALDAEARRLKVQLFYIERTDDTDLLSLVREPVGLKTDRGKTRLVFFFSPKDVEYALGWDRFREAIHAGDVRQHNNLSGRVGPIVLRDICGWAGKMPLMKFADALGVPMPRKSRMDPYKCEMRRGLKEQPAEFLRYAVADARVLLRIYAQFVAFVRGIQSDVLGMTDGLWGANDIPITCGRLVANTFDRWLYAGAGAEADAVRVCSRKLGFLDPDAARYSTDKERRLALLSRCCNPAALAEVAADPDGQAELRAYARASYLFTAMDAGGVRWWASRPTTETAGHNALVHGGRCHNEYPHEYETGPGLDVDVAGCYGASLRTLTFPVGVPSVWSYSSNEARPTLGQWLARNERALVSGLWMCTVSGSLPFEQDLLYSKLVRACDIRKAAVAGGDDIRSDFVLLRREVKNAVLTADMLTALRAVATNTEWAALQRLEVVTAAAYLAKDRRDDPSEWCREVLADPDAGSRVRVDAGTVDDLRTRVWYGVPLEGFVGRLADERERCRASGPKGRDAVLKLLINTLYGVLTSRHFAVGNTILANNITARARLGTWMLARALGLRQSITDGGIYTPSAVPHYRGKRPGLDTLSRPWDWSDPRRGRTLAPLAGLTWTPGEPVPANADAAALAHVREFWEPYSLPFPFTLAHKSENAFRRAAYWSKADYALLTEQGTVYKIRGKSRSRSTDRHPHPTFRLLDAIIDGSDDFPRDLSYHRGGILKVGKYRTIQASEGGYAGLKHLRPGDSLPEVQYLTWYNNTHFPLADESVYLRRRNRKKFHRGRRVEWFERYRAEGIARVHEQASTDKLTTVKR